jgi:hypothetical protein
MPYDHRLPNIPGVTWAVAISTDPRASKAEAFSIINDALKPSTPSVTLDQTKQLTDDKTIDLLLTEEDLL